MTKAEPPEASDSVRRHPPAGTGLRLSLHYHATGAAWWLLTIVAAALFLPGCRGETMPEDDWGVVVIAPGAAIPVGLSVGLSGQASGIGADIRDGLLLAVADRPAVHGHPVRILSEDDACDGEAARSAAERLTAAQTVAVIGPMCSAGALAASDLYEATHVTFVTPSATAPVITSRNLTTVFRVAWNDRIQGAAQAEFALQDIGARTAFLVHDRSVYGQSLADVFLQAYEAGGGSVIGQGTVSQGQIDFTELVQQIKELQPQVIVFAGFTPEGTLLIQQLRDAAVPTPFLGSDGLHSRRDFIDAAVGTANGAYVSSASPVTGPLYDDFFIRFAERYGREPGIFAAETYDAYTLVVDAIERVTVVRDDGSLLIGRKALNDALRTSHLAGASGEIAFTATGDRRSAGAVTIYRVQKGDFTLVREVPVPALP